MSAFVNAAENAHGFSHITSFEPQKLLCLFTRTETTVVFLVYLA
jgi:hypothetical protein